MRNSKGISLISLIVTIIVTTIIIATVGEMFGEDGLVRKAKANALVTELTIYNEELRQKIKIKEIQDLEYDSTTINAQYIESQNPITETNIMYWIPSFEEKYIGKVVIRNGQLAVIGTELSQIEIQEITKVNITILN